jgi:putative transposase
VNGRKRHLLVDTTGLLLKAVVHPANIPDRAGAKLVLASLDGLFPRLRHLWLDAGYAGALPTWIAQHLGWTVEVVRRARRWMVERTFAWLGRSQRLSKDYEALSVT